VSYPRRLRRERPCALWELIQRSGRRPLGARPFFWLIPPARHALDALDVLRHDGTDVGLRHLEPFLRPAMPDRGSARQGVQVASSEGLGLPPEQPSDDDDGG